MGRHVHRELTLRRVLLAAGGAVVRRALVLLVVATLVFALLEGAQGDAVDAYLAGTGGAPAFAEAMRERLGLGGTMLERYALYLGRLASLDLGMSVAFGRPVADVLAERLPTTLLLGGAAFLATAAIGTGLGALAARRPGGGADHGITILALVLNATPGFVVALVLALVFALKLGWLPLGGLSSIRPAELPAALDTLRHLVLPVATLTLTHLALYVRVVRAAVARALGSDGVRFARAKGLSGWRLGWRHVLRPALAPLIALAGVQAGTLLGGSVVVETVFAVPGYGSLAAMAVAQRDGVLLAGVVLSGALVVMAANVLADLGQRLADPRLAVR